ncbi:hypothetical protein [Fructobacillus fructosus]|uniref:Uncharacterized protein n=1 Tax=Fructobacillus fructosus TaxID=1631 RepID=A0ABM9MYD9_9LACO|nr:hypothetical protein [Fructobacillus fructosus]MBD9364881.1 hypothetical protein [Leuconostoc mesenteroides]KRN51739.1 hypothetical protein IV71_GL000506 [Fructobacillus fructosus KCTC 3544]MBC9118404.1 hypothetical protein [Fructobacillus fructosus]CAK1225393.1 unnamed protein product [Fructobacillus fructosus]CAK1225537.1 unnamed protein product [Fructobacillus fructosus]
MQFLKEHFSRKRQYYIVGLFIALVVVVVGAFVLGQQSAQVHSEVRVNQPASQSNTKDKAAQEKSESEKVAKADGDQNNGGKG